MHKPSRSWAGGVIACACLTMLTCDAAWVRHEYRELGWDGSMAGWFWKRDAHVGCVLYGPKQWFFFGQGESGWTMVDRGIDPNAHLNKFTAFPIARVSSNSSGRSRFGPWVPVAIHEHASIEYVDATTLQPLDPATEAQVRAAYAARWNPKVASGDYDRVVILWEGVLHTAGTVLVLLVFLRFAGALAIRQMKARRTLARIQAHACIRCNYPIRAMNRCPECGTPAPDATPTPASPARGSEAA